ncbi:MAG: hypothetical protein ABIN79_10450 [Marmoricola sp.]
MTARTGRTGRRSGGWWRLTWEGVAGVVSQESLVVAATDGASPEHGGAAPAY